MNSFRKILNPCLGVYFGVPLYAHWSWMLFMFMLLPSLEVFVLFIGVYLCVILHEYGHILAAKHLSIPVGKVTLYPLGGMATIEIAPNEPKEELFVTIMGPMVNMVLAGIFGGLVLLFSYEDWIYQYLYGLLYINVMLVVFNLFIPAFPLDGGRVLRSFLARFMDYRRATWWAVRVGQLTCIALLVYAVVQGMIVMAFVMPLVALTAQAELTRVVEHFEFCKLRQIFVLAKAGKWQEAEEAVQFLEFVTWKKLIPETLDICKNTQQPNYDDLLDSLDYTYPQERIVFKELVSLECACLAEHREEVLSVLKLLDDAKSVEEIDEMVEKITHHPFKLRCKELIEEIRQKANCE